MSQPRQLEALVPQCILKHHCVADAALPSEGLAEAQTLMATLFQMTTKRKKVSVESVGPAEFFTPDECGSLGAHTLFLCQPGLRTSARTMEQNFALRPERERLRGIFLFIF